MCADAETGDNNDELERQIGRTVSYGDVIQVKLPVFELHFVTYLLTNCIYDQQ